ncbi:MAG: hypothetical protein ABW046_16975 [Actinoplanes sp.]
MDEGADEPIGEFVARFAGLDATGQEETRAALTREDQHKLIVYAQRSAFAAVRQMDPGLVRSAVIAMSLVTEDAVGDDRVIWTIVGFICHARRRVGGLADVGVAAMLDRADQTVQQAFERMLGADGDLLFDSGVREVTTGAGLVFVEDKEDGPYESNADLVAMVSTIAELLEADRYHVETLIIGDRLPPYAYDDVSDHVDSRQTAAVRVEAVVPGVPYQPLCAFVVEFPDGDAAAIVAAAADRRDWPDEIQLAVAAGPICAVLRMDYRENEPFHETVDGLERFRAGLLAAIRTPAT